MRSVPGEEKSAWSSWLKVESKLAQSCLEVVWKLSRSCLNVASVLSQSCHKVNLKLAFNCLKVFVIVVIDVVVALDYNYIRWKSKRVPTLSDFTASLVCLLWTGI